MPCISCVDSRRESSPLCSTKKYCRKGYIFCSIFLSKSQTWYIITARSVVDIISPLGCISSPKVYSSATWWYTRLHLDDIQNYVLMICTPRAWFVITVRLSLKMLHQIRTQNRIQLFVPILRFLLPFRGIFALSRHKKHIFDKRSPSSERFYTFGGWAFLLALKLWGNR